MNNYKKLSFILLLLLIIPIGLFSLSHFGKKDKDINSDPFPEQYQTFIYPLIPHGIDATLESRYPISYVPKTNGDLKTYEKRYKIINILRIVYRNNTKQDLHDVKIKLHFTGMLIRILLSSFSNIAKPDYPPDIFLVRRTPELESGKVNVAEIYFYAPQEGTAKVYAEISSQEGYKIKTNTLTIKAE
ncbi:MAG TPA: hypothetical protein VLG67_02075 [Candidatus Saccharimonadales bacterium]|nr:hypothetical protein [Candidatus Saccharimonadales bacterium]